ncbi:MAG TPA: sigma-70 family RNA polymerase sigma factor [Rhodocyclaceae bacterium]|nr:sigma-70 family RNA polymerase sigma factor [Rhodocyclaceae bacterium]
MDDESIRSEVGSLRPLLLRFARLQLRDEAAAEDAVQECLLAALTGEQKFAGRSALRTWLTGILRHKIVDHIRRRAREPSLQAVDEDGDERDFDGLFQADGHWAEAPANWGDPQRVLENKRFHDVFEACLEILPAKTARVFMMREFLGLETSEICKELAMSTTNCWVVLYRARMRLRECLQLNWFGSEPGGVKL